MRMWIAAVAAAMLLGGCTKAAEMSCQAIADKVKEESQSRGSPLTSLTDVQEQSKTPTEHRCTATATVASGASAMVYLRGREADGQQQVELSETPFD